MLYESPIRVAIGIVSPALSGGLAGGCVSVFFNRLSRWRELRTKFYPLLSDIFSAYLIRLEKPEGRYWTTVIGNIPSLEDENFIEHRGSFTSNLVSFSELKEVRVLRKLLLKNMMSGDHTRGAVSKFDLAPESAALAACLATLHKKLKID